jgi:hypothetical protein
MRDIGHRTFLIAALTLATCGARAWSETLVCDGVLGNSGEQGKDLVRFGAEPARGMGVACDRFGSLWDRAGKGTLDRYAADGRMLGQYRIAGAVDNRDQLTLAGDTLTLLLGSRLYALPVTAAPGAEAKDLHLEARCISFGSWQGAIAAAQGEELVLLDPANGAVKPVARLRDVEAVELGPDGTLYAVAGGKVHRYAGGAESADGWPRALSGDRPQLLAGWWYTSGWHGTIRRYDAGLDPAPGVVMGGASGSFIGHLDQNAELFNCRGLARLGGDLYALSGLGGVLQLATWHGERQQLEVVRRISAVQDCVALGLDADGAVYHRCGAWDWNSRPDAPLRSGVNPPEELGQATMLENDRMVVPGFLWGKPSFYHGKLDGEVAIDRIEKGCALRHDSVGSAVYRDGDKTVLLVVGATGAAQAFAIDAEGRYRGDLGEVTLATATPVARWTSLAMRDAATLLAGGDGAVIEFARDGGGWREKRRWNSWGTGPDEHFGARVHLAADARTLAVADRERQRVLCFDPAGGRPRAAFGHVDAAGDDLGALAAPATLAVRGARLVVFDGGNQRLLKLRMAP